MSVLLSLPKKLKERGADIWTRTSVHASDLLSDLKQFIRRGGERLWQLNWRRAAR